MAGEIEIRIGALTLTCRGEVDTGQLEDVLRTVRKELPGLMQTEAEAPKPTAAELLAGSSAKTYGDKAGIAAFWLEEHGGRHDWRSSDIVDVLQEAGEAAPANITDTLNQKRDKGLFEVHDRRWKLTGEGRGWVKYSLLAATS